MQLIDTCILVLSTGINLLIYFKSRKTHQEIEKVYSRHAAIEKRFGHIERSMEMIASRIKMKDK